ncbi:DNA-processing protein DprA [Thermobifida fusca]|uniref:DNA-processing protein DprA n=1 Tax=Thermobifida TaxID=83677 RepID=UPI0003A4D824|nr:MULTISPECIES: DNA-processing protein DprA [Thermobifida]MBO2529432.1 DNA-protecting protein DprA [Thermobifida sp.]MDD6792600.1 DNA-processing protein DprA [Thermobifida fusca]PZN66249.1 MAG: DNA-protecting protein DprA [Thermobifida fusca]QOS60236.1 DNA-protecting protein DprA [Thermobifida fusca]
MTPAEQPQAACSAGEAAARAGWSAVAEPGDPVLDALLRTYSAAQAWEAVRAGTPLPLPGTAVSTTAYRRWERWQACARDTDVDGMLTRAGELGIRLVVPGDPEWPSQLDLLAERRPYALWVRGTHDLRNACLRSVSIVGSRAASAYGLHVAVEMAATLAHHGWCVVSGGAYGIDGAAHRGALSGDAATVAVLACGVDLAYPKGHEQLFAEVVNHGVVVSEYPPGTAPTRHAFLVRNRLIAALTPGTVVVEAGQRSGAMNTAAHAQELGRTLMAVPGPVTSALSAGCHRLLRDYQAVCVTGARDVMEQLSPLGAAEGDSSGGVQVSADLLDDTAQRVLGALPERGSAGVARIAAASGLGPDAALRQLGLLAAAGHVERTPTGWRRRIPGARRPRG